MNQLQDTLTRLGDLFRSSPITAVALTAAAVAFASTPLAFAFMGRMHWFNARRGRTLQRPSFWSIVCSMLMVMGIPAIFLALLVKSQSFDKDRYEFDPNRTFSVVDQGRQYEARTLLESAYKLDEAVRAEQKRLADIRKELTDGVKTLDTAMLALRESARQAPVVIAPMNAVLETLGSLRQAVEVDAPQQLVNLTAEPAALAGAPTNPAGSAYAMTPPAASGIPAPSVALPTAANGLPKAEIAAILAATPDPQKPLVTMLPLDNLPVGWELAKIPGKAVAQYVESFNADNLFEKMDGAAEGYLQNGVQGMACCSYHPKGDESSEIQFFIFEMGDPLKARGKFDAEKPDEATPLPIGEGAYTSGGSVFVHAARYYTVASVAQEDPKLSAFAKTLAERVAAQQKRPESTGPTSEDLFELLPEGPQKSGAKYVAQDVFGYSFLSDVFLTDYEVGDMKFQGFLRPYANAEEAAKVFEQYVETAKLDGAEVREIEDSKAEKMIVSSNFGMVDVVFLKGNAVAGANGAIDGEPAETFARKFAETLPVPVPMIGGGKKPEAAEGADDAEIEGENE